MEFILVFLFLLLLTPFILAAIGLALRFSRNELKRKKGRKLLLIALISLGVEILVGFAVCSNLMSGNMH